MNMGYIYQIFFINFGLCLILNIIIPDNTYVYVKLVASFLLAKSISLLFFVKSFIFGIITLLMLHFLFVIITVIDNEENFNIKNFIRSFIINL